MAGDTLTFRAVVLDVIRVAGAVQVARAVRPRGPQRLGVMSLLHVFRSPEQADEAPLLAALTALHETTLRKLLHLAYVGRGDCWFTSRSAHEIQGVAPTARDVAFVLAEKGPLADYLTHGLEQAVRGDVDLEAAVLMARGT